MSTLNNKQSKQISNSSNRSRDPSDTRKQSSSRSPLRDHRSSTHGLDRNENEPPDQYNNESEDEQTKSSNVSKRTGNTGTNKLHYKLDEIIMIRHDIPTCNIFYKTGTSFKVFREQIESFASMHGFKNWLTLSSDQLWKRISIDYANASNASSIYRSFRETHSQLYHFILNSFKQLTLDKKTLILTIEKKFLSDNDIDIYDDEENDEHNDVNDYTGIFINENVNLLWTYLIKRYDVKKSISVSFNAIITDLINMKFDESTMTPQDFIEKLNKLFTKLNLLYQQEPPLAGNALPESLKVAFALRALPPSLNQIESLLNTMNNVTIEVIEEQLIRNRDSKLRKSKSKTLSSHTEDANVAINNSDDENCYTAVDKHKKKTNTNYRKKKKNQNDDLNSNDSSVFNNNDTSTKGKGKLVTASAGHGWCCEDDQDERIDAIYNQIASGDYDEDQLEAFVAVNTGKYPSYTGKLSTSVSNKHVIAVKKNNTSNQSKITDTNQNRKLNRIDNTKEGNHEIYALDEIKSYVLVFDSAASKHIISNPALITGDLTKLDIPYEMSGLYGASQLVTHTCTVRLNEDCVLFNCAFIKNAGVNLISANQIIKAGCRYHHDGKDTLTIVYKNEEIFKFFKYKANMVYRHPLGKVVFDRVKKYVNDFGIEAYKRITTKSNCVKARNELNAACKSTITPSSKPISTTSAKSTPSTTISESKTSAATAYVATDDSSNSDSDLISTDAHSYDRQGNESYFSDIDTITEQALVASFGANSGDSITYVSEQQLFHQRLGHIKINKNIAEALHIKTIDTRGVHLQSCDTCLLSKSTRTGTGIGQYEKPTISGYRLDIDIIGPVSRVDMETKLKIRLPSLGNNLYILNAIDSCSNFTWTKLLKRKSDASEQMIIIFNWIKTHTGNNVHNVHSDGGGEFVNNILKDYYSKHGITHTYTPRNSPSLNGRIERFNRSLLERTRAMLTHSGASESLWGEAIIYANFIYNRTPLKSLKYSDPYAIMFENHPSNNNTEKIKVWGCDAYSHHTTGTTGKFSSTAQRGIFIGFDESRNAYRILTGDGTIIMTRDVKFNEQSFRHLALFKRTNNDAMKLHVTNTTVISDEEKPFSFNETFTDDDNDEGIDDDIDNDECNVETILHSASKSNNTFNNGTSGDINGDTCTDQYEINHENNSDIDDIESVSSHEIDDDRIDDSATSGDDSDTDSTATDDVLNSDVISGDTSGVDGIVSGDNLDIDIITSGDDLDTGDADSDHDNTLNAIPLTDMNTQVTADTEVPITDAPRRSTRITTIPSRMGFINPNDLYSSDRALLKRVTGSYVTDSLNDGTSYTATIGNNQYEIDLFDSTFLSGILTEEEAYYVVNEADEPNSYREAIKSRNVVQWKAAIDDEMKSMSDNQVLSLVKIPSDGFLLGTRWVFKFKRNELNQIIKYKSRLVCQGFRQREDIDFFDTYSPVVRFKSIKTIFAIAAQYNMTIKQLDFKTAFLNATLKEDIYIRIPDGVNDDSIDKKKFCYKLNRALYGLKQSPLEWYSLLHKVLTDIGYTNTIADPCVYYKHVNGTSIPIIISVYVDDIIIIYMPELENIWLKDKLIIQSKYSIDDIGDCKFCLKMKIDRDPNTGIIKVSQQGYVMSILEEYGMTEIKTQPNPCLSSILTDPDTDDSRTLLNDVNKTLYQSIVGSLMYLCNTTRIDICYIVNLLSRYSSAPMMKHLKAVRQVLRYIAGTPSLCLVFKPGTNKIDDFVLSAWTDADWGGDKTTRCSTLGNIITINGNLVNWLSQKQKSLSQSTTEAEFVGMNAATREIIWFQSLLHELFGKHLTSTIYTDSQPARDWFYAESIKHSKIKHIDIKAKYVKKLIDDNIINIHWVSTEKMLADILTKGLSANTFIHLRDQLLVEQTES